MIESLRDDTHFVGLYQGDGIEKLVGSYGELHVFSGTFNPLTKEDRTLFSLIDPEGVERSEYRPGFYAFSSLPVYLAYELTRSRSDEELFPILQQFDGYAPVLLTPGNSFHEKADLLLQHCQLLVFHLSVSHYRRIAKNSTVSEVESIPASFCIHAPGGVNLKGRHPSNCRLAG